MGRRKRPKSGHQTGNAALITRLSTILALALCATACSDDKKEPPPPCVDGSKACGVACDEENECAPGLYCAGAGTCAKQCVVGSEEHACEDDGICSPDGQCPSEDVPCIDGDVHCGDTCSDEDDCPDGLYCTADEVCAKQCLSALDCTDNLVCTLEGRCPDDGDDAGTVPSADGGDVCADTVVTNSRVTPNVILIIDQSGSMEDTFSQDDNGNDVSRWNALRSFLLNDPDGLIADLQGQVRFGLALYSARNQGGDNSGLPDGECPLVTTVLPKLDNYNDIADVYNAADPISDTPTGDAIDRIVADLNLINPAPDASSDPYIFILATDGNPDRCEQLNPHDDPLQRTESVEATERAYDLGVRTFIISVGADIDEQHQQDVANAGLGVQPGEDDAEYWRAGDDATLKNALRGIVSGQIGCEVQLDGMVVGDACEGIIKLNGKVLECEADDGWELTDPEHILLKGAACDELKDSADAFLEVVFPCGANVDVLL